MLYLLLQHHIEKTVEKSHGRIVRENAQKSAKKVFFDQQKLGALYLCCIYFLLVEISDRWFLVMWPNFLFEKCRTE